MHFRTYKSTGTEASQPLFEADAWIADDSQQVIDDILQDLEDTAEGEGATVPAIGLTAESLDELEPSSEQQEDVLTIGPFLGSHFRITRHLDEEDLD